MPDIETRRDLARHLQAQMAASRGGWSVGDEDDEEVSGRTLLKTYLVEAHRKGDDVLASLQQLGARAGFVASETKDPDLFRLTGSAAEFWCDTSFGRFWQLHTTASVKDADPLRDTIISSAPWVDKVWFPPNYLEAFPEKVGAQLMVFSLYHDRRDLSPAGRSASDFDFVTMRLWSSMASSTLEKMRRADVFPHGVSLRSVRLHSGSDEADGEYCVAEYHHDGKVTASGTSFDEHNRLLLRALKDYRNGIEHIETTYGLGATTDEHGHPLVAGNPIVIDVEWEVEDLEYAVARIFASNEPFRLWALPERLAPDHYRARAVDLHFGGVLSFDITRRNVVIQLPKGVCGNTVVRFLNNLRFHVNADAADPA